jgi:hypothetical protein
MLTLLHNFPDSIAFPLFYFIVLPSCNTWPPEDCFLEVHSIAILIHFDMYLIQNLSVADHQSRSCKTEN